MAINLLIADVDGTLITPDKQITERTKEAVRKLAAANIGFAITSGRPPRGMTQLIEPLGLHTPIAGFNGGMIVNTDLTPIDVKAIPPDHVVPIIRALIARSLDVWIYQNNDWFLRDPTAPYAERESKTVKFAPIVTANLEDHIENVVKIVGVSPDHALMEAVEDEARERFGDRLSAARSRRTISTSPTRMPTRARSSGASHATSASRSNRSRPSATWPTTFSCSPTAA